MPGVFCDTRGLPQRVASNVLLAELAIAPLLWRLTRHDWKFLVWSYLDDINLMAASPDKLVEAAHLFGELESDFSLCLSAHKASILTNDNRNAPLLREVPWVVMIYLYPWVEMRSFPVVVVCILLLHVCWSTLEASTHSLWGSLCKLVGR